MKESSKSRIVAILFLASSILVVDATQVNAKGYSSCATLKVAYSNVIARSITDKNKFLSLDSIAAQVASAIAVKPRIYSENTKLDFDRDGLLCEDDLDRAVAFARLAQIIQDINSGGASSKILTRGWSECSFNGKKIWGSVYISNSRFSADFIVYRTYSRFSADISVYLDSSRYSPTFCGLWYITDSRYSADFSIYITDSRYSADFSIYITDSRYSAGRN